MYPATRTRIHVGQESDLAFWARLLDASPEEIRCAVHVAGPDLTAVRTYLRGRQMRLDFGALPAEFAATATRGIPI